MSLYTATLLLLEIQQLIFHWNIQRFIISNCYSWDSTTVNYTTYFAFSTAVFSLSPCVNTSDLKELCRSLPIKYQKITFSITILSLLIPLIVILWFSRLLSFSYRQLSFIMLLIPVNVTVKTPMISL